MNFFFSKIEIWIYDGNSAFYCDSDIKLDQCKSFLVSIINILKIINSQDSVKRGKNCTDEWFYFLCGVIMLWVKLCQNVWRAGLHSYA